MRKMELEMAAGHGPMCSTPYEDLKRAVSRMELAVVLGNEGLKNAMTRMDEIVAKQHRRWEVFENKITTIEKRLDALERLKMNGLGEEKGKRTLHPRFRKIYSARE